MPGGRVRPAPGILFPLLLAALAVPSVTAQAFPSDGREGRPFEILEAGNYTLTMGLQGRDYFFVYSPARPAALDFRFEQGGRQFEHLMPRYPGGTTIRPPADGPVAITVRGAGTFAVVDGTLTGNLHLRRETLAVQPVGGRYAWALGRDVSPSHFCLQAEGAFNWTLRDDAHAVLAAGASDANHSADVEFETEGIYQIAFVEGLPPRMAMSAVDAEPCFGAGAEARPGGQRAPVPQASMAVVIALAAALRRRMGLGPP